MCICTTCCSACVVQSSRMILFLTLVLKQVKPPSNRQRQVLDILKVVWRLASVRNLLKVDLVSRYNHTSLYTPHHQKLFFFFFKHCKHTPPNNAYFTSQERSSTPAGFLGIVISETRPNILFILYTWLFNEVLYFSSYSYCHYDPYSLPMHAWWVVHSPSVHSQHSLPLFPLKQKLLVWQALITSLIRRRSNERNTAPRKR